MYSDWKEVNNLIDDALDNKVFPGGILKVVSGEGTVFERCFGVTDFITNSKVDFDTVYDLASLTKPLATTVALIKLHSEGKIRLSQPLSDFIDKIDSVKGSITIAQLLDHTSGLPAHREYFLILNKTDPSLRKFKLRELLLNEHLEYQTGRKFVYSDLGFMFLSWIIEIVSGERMDVYVHSIYEELGIADLFFTGLLPDQANNYAVTEECPYRGLLRGVVHDDNCYSVSGVCGHAGLFGRVEGVLKLTQELIQSYKSESGRFERNSIRRFFKRQGQFKKPLGFDAPDEISSSCGKLFSYNTIGHLGFTGTSLWIDLERDIIVILLTNRVHPTRENIKIRKFRPRLHDAVMEVLL